MIMLGNDDQFHSAKFMGKMKLRRKATTHGGKPKRDYSAKFQHIKRLFNK